jgi:hypothetical protein
MTVFLQTLGFQITGQSRAPDPFYQALQRLMASVTYHKWQKWNKDFHPTEAERNLKKSHKGREGPQPLSMRTNVKTIFILFVLSQCISYWLLGGTIHLVGDVSTLLLGFRSSMLLYYNIYNVYGSLNPKIQSQALKQAK